MDLFVTITIIFIFTYIFGHFFERFRIPWLFASLFLGFIFSIFHISPTVFKDEVFIFLGELGMLFLLFVIGMEFDLKEFTGKAFFYGKATAFIIISEAILSGLTLHYLFSLPWLISFIVGFSFATVGEAILVPILEEFRMVRKPLGKALISIGIFDDVFEIFTLLIASMIVGMKSFHPRDVFISIFLVSLLFLLTYAFSLLREEGRKFLTHQIETLFLFILFIFFLFISLGKYAEAAPIGAVLAGVGIRSFLPKKRFALIESEIKSVAYGFFAPIFFVWVGVTTDFSSILKYPIETIIIVLVTSFSKIFASWLSTRKELGDKNSLILGLGLCVRFSTSIVLIKYFLENGIIGSDLYSILISSTAFFTLIVPILFSRIIARK